MPPECSKHTQEEMHVSSTIQPQGPVMHNRSTCQGPVAIFWDIKTSPMPDDVQPENVAGNVRMALHVHPAIEGAVMMFAAYGDFNSFPKRLRVGCQRTGVKLIDVPNGRKDAADKAILVDMFLFALDNHPPSTIMLISGDVDFAPALHILGQRGYTIILVIPSSVQNLSALDSAGSFLWDWPSVARGDGFIPPGAVLIPPQAGPSEVPGHLIGCPVNENTDGTHKEESIVHKGIPESYCNDRDCLVVTQSLSENNVTILPPENPSNSGLISLSKEVLATTFPPCEQNDLSSVQPGDINSLKIQLVNLLKMVGGRLRLTHIPIEYHKVYGRPLCVSNDGASKLVKLLNKMSDAISLDGKGKKKFIRLQSMRSGPVPTIAKRYKRDKKSQEDGINKTTGVGSADDGMVITGGRDDRKGGKKSNPEMVDFDKFKYELQEILVSYSCRIFLGCFEEIYLQRYKRHLEYQLFGANCLEELLDKENDKPEESKANRLRLTSQSRVSRTSTQRPRTSTEDDYPRTEAEYLKSEDNRLTSGGQAAKYQSRVLENRRQMKLMYEDDEVRSEND